MDKESDDRDSFEEDDLGTMSRITVNLKSIKPIKPIIPIIPKKAPIDMGSRLKTSPMQNNFLRLPTQDSDHQTQNEPSYRLGMGSMVFGSVMDHLEMRDQMEMGDQMEIPGPMAWDKTSTGGGTQRCQEDSNKNHRSGSIDAANKIQSTGSPLVANSENESLAGSEDNNNEIGSSIGDFGVRIPVEWNLDDFPVVQTQEFAVGRPSTEYMGLTKQKTYVQTVCEPDESLKKRLSNNDLGSKELASRERFITGLESRIQRHEAKLNMA